MSELKTCPFCGGKAKMVTRISRSIPNYPTAYIKCETCGTSTRVVADILKVIELWNERVGEQDETN